jgi:benzoyl-CoA 2,3-epoxidase subunit B
VAIDYQTKIPNNVDLSNDRALQRALEHWQPAFLDWWKELGPTTYQGHEVYLRTATSVDAKGWATFGHVKMPDYRWGIFLADQQPLASAITWASRPGSRFPASIARCCAG